MKILILGAGQVGTSLAKFLSRDKANDLTIVDRDAEKLANLQRKLDIKTVIGNAAYPTVLETADIQSMDMVIAVTQSRKKYVSLPNGTYTL